MRFATVLLVAFACSGAFASELGSPLGCEDWTVVAPGLTIEADDQGHGLVSRPTATDRVAFDNEGGRIIISSGPTTAPPSPCGADNLPILREPMGGGFKLLACISNRGDGGGCFLPARGAGSCVRINPITGDLFFSFVRRGTGYAASPTWCVMHGLTTLYDVQQTLSLAKTPSALKLNGLHMA